MASKSIQDPSRPICEWKDLSIEESAKKKIENNNKKESKTTTKKIIDLFYYSKNSKSPIFVRDFNNDADSWSFGMEFILSLLFLFLKWMPFRMEWKKEGRGRIRIKCKCVPWIGDFLHIFSRETILDRRRKLGKLFVEGLHWLYLSYRLVFWDSQYKYDELFNCNLWIERLNFANEFGKREASVQKYELQAFIDLKLLIFIYSLHCIGILVSNF